MFRRTRYQQGSLKLEERKRGSAVWVYRWWENDITGKPIRRKVQLGSLERYPNESAACAAADALRLIINNQSKRKNLRKTTVSTLWDHYCREELPLKEISTQDAYLVGITGVGWHTFRHTVGTMLAEMGEHQLMIRDYLRHSDMHVSGSVIAP